MYPSTSSVRRTVSLAGSETSTCVMRAPRGPSPSTNTRSLRSSIVAPKDSPSDSVPSSLGTSPRASTACSVPLAMAKIVRPSVLTVSGSSTPASCTLVSDVSSGGAPAAGVGRALSGALPAPSSRAGASGTGIRVRTGTWRVA